MKNGNHLNPTAVQVVNGLASLPFLHVVGDWAYDFEDIPEEAMLVDVFVDDSNLSVSLVITAEIIEYSVICLFGKGNASFMEEESVLFCIIDEQEDCAYAIEQMIRHIGLHRFNDGAFVPYAKFCL